MAGERLMLPIAVTGKFNGNMFVTEDLIVVDPDEVNPANLTDPQSKRTLMRNLCVAEGSHYRVFVPEHNYTNLIIVDRSEGWEIIEEPTTEVELGDDDSILNDVVPVEIDEYSTAAYELLCGLIQAFVLWKNALNSLVLFRKNRHLFSLTTEEEDKNHHNQVLIEDLTTLAKDPRVQEVFDLIDMNLEPERIIHDLLSDFVTRVYKLHIPSTRSVTTGSV